MKTKKILTIALVALSLSSALPATAQEQEIEQLLLNIEKLSQLKQILSDIKKGYQVVSKGYNTIKNISEGNFNLHQTFLDGLLEVSPAVRNYKKVTDIINYQLLLVAEYKQAYKRFKNAGNFSFEEIDYLGKVYGNLLHKSLRDLDDLTMVITARKLRMSDEERLRAIDNVFHRMEDKLMFLRHFNNNILAISQQRQRKLMDNRNIQSIYGLSN